MKTVIAKQYSGNRLSITHHSQLLITKLLAFLCLLLSANLVTHAAEPEDVIKYRQSIMMSQRAHMAAATAIIEGKVDFNDQLVDHVRALEATTKIIAGLFPEGSDLGDTKALASVWKNNAEFVKRAKHTQEKSQTLAKAVSSGDSAQYGTLLKDLLDACKACHKDFRAKEK